MAKGIQIVLKCLAVILALGMLAGYVWSRQRAAAPKPTAEFPIGESSEFPITPESPTLFDTSKSGKLTVDLGVTLVPNEEEKDPAAAGKKDVSDTSQAPMIMPGSKSINMPVFNTTDLNKGKDKIDELIDEASGSQKSTKP